VLGAGMKGQLSVALRVTVASKQPAGGEVGTHLSVESVMVVSFLKLASDS